MRYKDPDELLAQGVKPAPTLPPAMSAPQRPTRSSSSSTSPLISSDFSNSADWKFLHGQPKVSIEETESSSSGEKGRKDWDLEDEDVLDKGYAWVIVLGGFLTQVLIGGLMRSDGVFYLKFQEKFNQSKQLTAWPSSVSFTLQCFIAPVATAFCNRFSVRTSVHLGTLLLTAGMIVTAFAPNIFVLFLSYSVLQGLGRGLVLAPGIFIVNMYFSKKLGIALGLASAGTGIGTLTFPPLLKWLFDTAGYRTAFLITGGITSTGWIIGMLLRPLSTHKEIVQERLLRAELSKKGKSFYSWYGSIGSPRRHQTSYSSGYASRTDQDTNSTDSSMHISAIKKSRSKNNPNDLYNVLVKIDTLRGQQKKKNCCQAAIATIFPVEGEKRGKKRKRLFEWQLFRDFPFLVMCVSMAFFNIAQKTVFTFLPPFCEQQGVPDYGIVLSVAGAGDTVGRVAAGFLMDRPLVRPFRGTVYSLVLFVAAAAALVIPFSHSLLLFCVASCVYGTMIGASVSQKSTVLAALMGKETVNSAFGILYSFQGIGTLVGPPLSGALRDELGDYKFAFYLSGGSMFNAGALVALSVLLFGIRRRRREAKGGGSYEPIPNTSSEDVTPTFNNNSLPPTFDEDLSITCNKNPSQLTSDEDSSITCNNNPSQLTSDEDLSITFNKNPLQLTSDEDSSVTFQSNPFLSGSSVEPQERTDASASLTNQDGPPDFYTTECSDRSHR